MARLHRYLLYIEQGLLTSMFFGLLLVAAAQIIMRNFFDSGLMWGDDFVKVAVLWIGLSGAAYASRNSRHINIDVITRFLPEALGRKIYRFVYFITTLLCGGAAYFSYQFVALEKEDPVIAFLNIPTWVTELIIPVAFTIMAWRFFLLLLRPVTPGTKNK